MKDMTEYERFLATKRVKVQSVGFDIDAAQLNPMLFDWQKAIVRWALQRGRAALFEDCGLGKTPQQLEWANQVCKHTGGRVLILTPLAVARQTCREAAKFGITATVARALEDVQDGINVCNYEMAHKLTPDLFAGIVLDESSVLKSFDGETRKFLIEFAKGIQYRLCCTATPAPNDLIELTNHSEFLDVMSGKEIIAMFFKQDGNTTHQWRLKNHAVDDFWRWMAEWSIAIRRPSDIGYDNGAFALPPLKMIQIVTSGKVLDDMLFSVEANTLQERRGARKASLPDRVKACAEIVNGTTEQCLVWCDLNCESEALKAAIPHAVEVRGSDSREWKEAVAEWFIGNKCVCNLPEFRCKLSACKQNPTQTINENTTQRIESVEKQNQTSIRNATETSETHTCENGLNQTGIDSRKSAEQNQPNETQSVEMNTQETNLYGLSAGANRRHGKKEIQKRDLRSGSGNTESLRKSMGIYSNYKEEDALSAEPNSQRTSASEASQRPEQEDSTLTTTTKQDESEEYCAQVATLQLENSETIQNCSTEHHCICGHETGRRVLISKSSIYGFGLNFQNCNKCFFVGLSDSYEQFYQAIRRNWRFGQKREVSCYVITSECEGAVVANIERKEKQATDMFDNIVKHMNVHSLCIQQEKKEMDYRKDEQSGEGWRFMLGDSCERIKEIETDSIGITVFSPPFPGMYAYTNSARDIGNCKNFSELLEHFQFLMSDILRITKPGRMCCVHLTQEPVFKGREGYVGLRDFRGDCIRAMESAGWLYYSEVTIDKNPMLKASRTKEATLLFKTLAGDSSMSRPALADYLLVFKKAGENTIPVRSGISEKYENTNGWITQEEWCEWAAPVWYRAMPKEKAEYQPFQGNYPSRHQFTDGISETDVLQASVARDEKDEKHLCPLQLGVIERCIKLWSAPGDTLFTPFGGIGSEGYMAVKLGRKALLCELKDSYWRVGCDNLRSAEKTYANRNETLL